MNLKLERKHFYNYNLHEEILLDAKFTIGQTKDKVIQRLQQHIKLYYDIERPALIEPAEEDQETVDDVQDGVLEEVQE